jgi:thiol-disulfide isomerase/thioredoxin
MTEQSANYKNNQILGVFSLIMGLISIPASLFIVGMVPAMVGLVITSKVIKRDGGTFLLWLALGVCLLGFGMGATFSWTHFHARDVWEQRLNALVSKQFPEELFQSIDGEQVFLKKGMNKVNVCVLFSTGCRPCQLEVPILNKLSERDGLSVIGFSSDSKENLFAFKKIFGTKYPLVNRDKSHTYFDTVIMFPTVFILDSDLKIQYVNTGLLELEDFEKILKDMRGSP